MYAPLASYVAPYIGRQATRMYSTTRNRSTPYLRGRRRRFKGKVYKKKVKRKVKKDTVKTLKKKVNENTKRLDTSQVDFTYRVGDKASMTWTQNQSKLHWDPILTYTRLRNILSAAPLVEPGNNTVTEVNLTSGTFQRDILIHSVYASVHYRNNTTAPMKLRHYVMKTKRDTAVDPVSEFSLGLQDVIGPGFDQNRHIFPTDSELMTDVWKIVSSKSFILEPGKERVFSHSSKAFEYDQSYLDSRSFTYQKSWPSWGFMVRGEGCLQHDTTDNRLVGFSGGHLDISTETTFKIEYDGGSVGLKRIKVEENADDIENGVIANKPCVCLEPQKATQDGPDTFATLASSIQAFSNANQQLLDNIAQILIAQGECETEEETEEPETDNEGD